VSLQRHQVIEGVRPAQLGRYLEALRVANYSPRTVTTRDTYLGYFLRWGEDRGLTQPREITKPILDRYRKWLYYHRKENGKPLSFRSQHHRLVAVRALFRWLARENAILFNPASELELPKLETSLPRHVLTAEEAEAVLRQPDLATPLGVRDRALLETLYSTGIRRLELVQLSVFDVEADRRLLLVRQGKGRKDRRVPIGERALAWVEKYRLEVRPRYAVEPDPGTLFLSSLGQAIEPARMSQLVRTYVRQAEIGKSGACHLFRHTCATLLLEAGMDIRYIQQLLGHARLDTTQIYTQVSIRELARLHAALHPAARLARRARREDADAAEAGAAAAELLAALDDEAAEEALG
jgi:integrase/recombinase XerD